MDETIQHTPSTTPYTGLAQKYSLPTSRTKTLQLEDGSIRGGRRFLESSLQLAFD